MDFKLSDIMGDLLAKKLKEQNKNMKIIFVTGYSEIKDGIFSNNLANQVMLKPVRDDKLVEIVEQALDEKIVAMKNLGEI